MGAGASRGLRGAVRPGAGACLLAAVATLTAACVPDRPIRTAVDGALRSVACADEVRATLREWNASEELLHSPPGAGGSVSYRLATDRFAEWVVLSLRPGGAPTVVRTTPTGATGRIFRPDCTWETRRQERVRLDRSAGSVLTDLDLEQHLRDADGPIVIYVWSPHMPLSVDGWPEIAAAARSVGVEVVPVLMAHSDRRFAQREARRVGMPVDGLREIDSNELDQRQAQVHAPSIVIFGAGRASPVLPGYRNADGYRRYLDGFLRGR